MFESKASKQNKKTNQIPVAVIILIVIMVIGFFVYYRNPKSALLWGFGIAVGFVLQRCRFCFAASLRDPILTGGTSLTKSLILTITIATVGFSALQYYTMTKGLSIPGNIYPVGMNTVVGGILFGIGMVVAGGCASGTLMRIGEGFSMQILTLLFFMIGSLWGARDFSWWAANIIPQNGIFLPDVLGWPLALVIQFTLLLSIFILSDWYGEKRLEEYK